MNLCAMVVLLVFIIGEACGGVACWHMQAVFVCGKDVSACVDVREMWWRRWVKGQHGRHGGGRQNGNDAK